MKKRLISFFTIITMILAIQPVFVFANPNSQADKDSSLINSMKAVLNQYSPSNTSNSSDELILWKDYVHKKVEEEMGLNKTNPVLNWHVGPVATGWAWSGTEASGTQCTDDQQPENPKSIPYKDSNNKFFVYSGEQLVYALENSLSGGSIVIKADIDLNGQAGESNNWPWLSFSENLTIDGDNHNIYNLRIDNANSGAKSNVGFLAEVTGIDLQNLSFDYANVSGGIGKTSAGVALGKINSNSANKDIIKNVNVKNATIFGQKYLGGIFGLSYEESLKLIACSMEDSLIFGSAHIGSLCGRIDSGCELISRCYSVGSKVFSVGDHSGGFMACGGSLKLVEYTFTDVEVYGYRQTGGFAGGLNGNCNFVSCYTSGSIEGVEALGGFIGRVENANSTPGFVVKDSYSTVSVGMRNSGNMLGGFVGEYLDAGLLTLENCYSAGEVGSLDTDSQALGTSASYNSISCRTRDSGDFVGGMVGKSRTNGLPNTAGQGYPFYSCYYDKQTTAMRDWAIGNANGYFSTGLTGVLTTDSAKSGNGLMNTDPENTGTTGFKGFTWDTSSSYTGRDPGFKPWDYSLEGHYPELSEFKNPDIVNWGSQKKVDLVKAYSLASTSGPQLKTWDYGLNTATGQFGVGGSSLDEKIYCTVRDLTSSFGLTSSGDNVKWEKIGGGNGVGTITNIAGADYSVLDLSKDIQGNWFASKLVPGIEWLKVSYQVGNETATRRVRVVPTASIYVGGNENLNKGSLYDHRDSVELFFSTGKRMASNFTDITTGIYPDKNGELNALTPRQVSIGTGRGAGSDDNTKFTDVSLGYMSSYNNDPNNDDNAQGSKAYVYVYSLNNDGSVKEGPLDLATAVLSGGESVKNLITGYTAFPDRDEKLLIKYMWVLKDGRVLGSSKTITVNKTPVAPPSGGSSSGNSSYTPPPEKSLDLGFLQGSEDKKPGENTTLVPGQKTEILPGKDIPYTLIIKNTGDKPLKGVWLRTYVPDYASFVSVKLPGKYGVINGKEHITWFVEDLPPGASFTLDYVVAADYCLPVTSIKTKEVYYQVTGNETPPPTNIKKNPEAVLGGPKGN